MRCHCSATLLAREYAGPHHDRDCEFYQDLDNRPSTELTRWADEAMFSAAPIQGLSVTLLSATPDPLGAIAAACRMYEGKPTKNLSEVTDDERRHYWTEMSKTHLQAPLEFVDLHFFLEGVNRAFTHQMVRQRTAVYAQESLRFAVKENLVAETPLPPSLRGKGNESAKELWAVVMDSIEHGYNALIAGGMPAEDARGLLPHATTTRLHYKTNLRNLLEHAGNRLCTQAQFEWREVFIGIVKAIHEYEPPVPFSRRPEDMLDRDSGAWQFAHIAESQVFQPICYRTGHCQFTAEFDRKCTIRERVQRGAFDEIHVEEWLADPTAGRRD